ncbi:acyltransferase family protein [Edaphobacter aggregans]|uniref:acyltransferase family protein n=1 Tax=Edaphobacter aggregans TaxID=570835 RepID=UPI000558C7FE|nr:acyltransferase [Edaphobacter aggregans]
MQHAAAINEQRFDQLDSFRGIAATMVVLSHFFGATNSTGRQEDLLRILVYPLKNGEAAVALFFLLSGFVLSLPVWRGKPQTYSVFIGRRICRIYLPYLFGLALSVLGASIFASHKVSGLAQWFYPTWTGPVDWTLVLKHILFIGPRYNVREFNFAFWTLIIEMRVSIILPFFLLFMRRLSYVGMWLVCAITFMIGSIGESRVTPLQIMGWTSFFMAGAIVARAVTQESSYLSRIFSRRSVTLLSLTVFFFGGLIEPILHLSGLLGRLPSAVGGLATICAALYNRELSSFLKTRALQFLGRVSYSLYLLHVTVLYTTFHLFYGLLPKTIIFVIYMAGNLVLATISYKLIEQPSMELGRRLTRKSITVPKESSTLIPAA